ncbi:hypothetical protein AMATHDRAFT_57898 [Amanita thiersii Skay4041]|uniref:Phosphoribulokinase/uridine kinase domain-containing protein n=1 Tax=Amanita thiersii Skay4041 TaxID=703135 RepID=A0A2A9NWJ2_9AGAR|nr:hypothetical protein AMATHDRAFT_57898 [Amanita thiersii Skay4041]
MAASPLEASTKVVFIGIGGATSSGKSTLAKHLQSILPSSILIHQDDFAPPQELVPTHPEHQVQDWDAAPGAIDWQRFVQFLSYLKATGVMPADHRSHDYLNEQKYIPISGNVQKKWVTEFKAFHKERQDIVWIIVDGFLLYWHPDVIETLDVRVLLRVPHDVLKRRRHERHGYHTAEGALWRDPPNYWENIVYPAYVDAHYELFENGDVERGALGSKVPDLMLLDILEMTMDEAVDRCCRVIREHTRDI